MAATVGRVLAYLKTLDGFYGNETPDDLLDYATGGHDSPALLLSDVRVLAAKVAEALAGPAPEDDWRCPTCGPHATEPHPRRPGVLRCSNCKEWAPVTPAPKGDDREALARVMDSRIFGADGPNALAAADAVLAAGFRRHPGGGA